MASETTGAEDTVTPSSKPLRLHGIEPKDRRVSLDPRLYPWRMVGRLNHNGSYCTGTLVGPSLIVTASHCFWDQRRQAWAAPGAYHFVLGYEKGEYSAHSRIRRYILPHGYGTGDARRPPTDKDWAIAVLDKPLGKEFGYFSLASFHEIDFRNQKPGQKNYFSQAGYSKDMAHVLTGDPGCRVRGMARNKTDNGLLLVHYCEATSGDSGSPILVREKDKYRLIAIHVATMMRKGQRDLGIAVPSDSFRARLRALLAESG